jgi:predicted component of type VI protein secretion system
LIAATLVGMLVGFAAGYMARPRALQQVEMSVPSEQPAARPVEPSPGPVELVEPELRPAPAPRPAPPPRTGTAPVALPPPPLANGELVVESIPRGAAVTVNGRPSGKTPLKLADLAPGEYRVTISMLGYREFATTVRVVAGERARAAARLTEQEQE